MTSHDFKPVIVNMILMVWTRNKSKTGTAFDVLRDEDDGAISDSVAEQ